MKKEDLILKTKQKIEEIDQKIRKLNNEVKQSGDNALKEKGEKILAELNDISENIQKEYTKLGSTESESAPELDKMDKNIFNSFKSFDSAFERAGSIFRTK